MSRSGSCAHRAADRDFKLFLCCGLQQASESLCLANGTKGPPKLMIVRSSGAFEELAEEHMKMMDAVFALHRVAAAIVGRGAQTFLDIFAEADIFLLDVVAEGDSFLHSLLDLG